LAVGKEELSASSDSTGLGLCDNTLLEVETKN